MFRRASAAADDATVALLERLIGAAHADMNHAADGKVGAHVAVAGAKGKSGQRWGVGAESPDAPPQFTQALGRTRFR